MTEGPAAADKPSRTRPHLGLSGKLLVLTLLFVMIAEVLIYVPSVANFRLNWLNDRLSAAYTAALVFETAPNGMVTDTVARQILDSIRARAVAVKMGQQRRLLAASEVPPAISHVVDMRDMPWHRAIIDAFETLICVDSDVMRVVGPAPMGEFVEIVLDEAPLRKAMVEFSIRILLLSLLISAITAALVYLALHVLLVRPMRRMTANMVAFRADPENPARIIAASEMSSDSSRIRIENSTIALRSGASSSTISTNSPMGAQSDHPHDVAVDADQRLKGIDDGAMPRHVAHVDDVADGRRHLRGRQQAALLAHLHRHRAGADAVPGSGAPLCR